MQTFSSRQEFVMTVVCLALMIFTYRISNKHLLLKLHNSVSFSCVSWTDNIFIDTTLRAKTALYSVKEVKKGKKKMRTYIEDTFTKYLRPSQQYSAKMDHARDDDLDAIVKDG